MISLLYLLHASTPLFQLFIWLLKLFFWLDFSMGPKFVSLLWGGRGSYSVCDFGSWLGGNEGQTSKAGTVLL